MCVCAGDVESTEPTKSLMRIAEYIDGSSEGGEGVRAWFLQGKAEVLERLAEGRETTGHHGKANRWPATT